MAINFTCVRCDRKYSVGDAMAGRRVTCKACGQEFNVPGGMVAARSAAFDDEDDDDGPPISMAPPRPTSRAYHDAVLPATRPVSSDRDETRPLTRPGVAPPRRKIAASSPLVGGLGGLLVVVLLGLGGFYVYQNGLPASLASFSSGNTARAQEHLAVGREGIALLDEMSGLFEQITDAASVQRVSGGMMALQVRGQALQENTQRLTMVTKAEDNYVRQTLGPEMRRSLTRFHASVQKLGQFPQSAGQLAQFNAQYNREIVKWGGTPENPVSVPPPQNFGAAPPGSGAAAPPVATAPPLPPDPVVPDDADAVTKSLIQLKSREAHKKSEAVERLGRTKPNDKLDEVVKALLPLLEHDDIFVVSRTIKTLVVWHTPEVVPALCDRLADNRGFIRHDAIKALGALRDPRAIEPLVDHMKEHAGEVRDALKLYGASAEAPLIGRLQDPDPNVRSGACEVLKDIGGKDTLRAMIKLPADPDAGVRSAATSAMEAIVARVGPIPEMKVLAGKKGR